MKKVIVIAEAGVNHNGSLDVAKELIRVAAQSGADYVKFQTFKAENIVSPYALKASYQVENIEDGDAFQFKMLKKLELSDENHIDLVDYAQRQNIKFLSTAFDVDGVHYLNELGLELFKIPSGEITNFPYLRAVALTQKPIILSTGMSNLGEIEVALNILLSNGSNRDAITILHCNTEYPTPMVDVNLKAMKTIGDAFGVNIGYSDHTLGIEVPIAAAALGATVIEKHFTLDRKMIGPDHKASLEPDELKEMISALRNIEKAMSGSGRKEASLSEQKNIAVARKSIHLIKDMKKGSIITENDIIPLRPGDGISAIYWNDIIGRELKENRPAFTKVHWSDLA